jgi:uncharacterized membrane protein YedE/YeeE
VAFACGVTFALGLGVGGMTQPVRVLAFLDVAGNWDPRLALVMLGAIAVYAPVFRLAVKRGRPLLAPAFEIPTHRRIDGRLLIGAVLFGIGWGLAGLCPGPALTSLASGKPAALIFVAAMSVGIVVSRLPRANTAHIALLRNGEEQKGEVV